MTPSVRLGLVAWVAIVSLAAGGCGREPADRGTRGESSDSATAPSVRAGAIVPPESLVARLLALDTAGEFWPDIRSPLNGHGDPGFASGNFAVVVASYRMCAPRLRADTATVVVLYGVLGTVIENQADGGWEFRAAPEWRATAYRVVHGAVIVPDLEAAHLSVAEAVARAVELDRDSLRSALAVARAELGRSRPPPPCDGRPTGG